MYIDQLNAAIDLQLIYEKFTDQLHKPENSVIHETFCWQLVNLNPFNLITVGDLHLSIFFFAFPFIFVHWAMIINFCSILKQILKDEIIKLVFLVLCAVLHVIQCPVRDIKIQILQFFNSPILEFKIKKTRIKVSF